MSVTVLVPLTTEEEAALLAQAKAQGVSVDSLLRQAVRRIRHLTLHPRDDFVSAAVVSSR